MDTNKPLISIEDIFKATDEIKPFIHRTPAVTSATADNLASDEANGIILRLVMKCENLQKVGGTQISYYFKAFFI
jgi:threonine dehydratase